MRLHLGAGYRCSPDSGNSDGDPPKDARNSGISLGSGKRLFLYLPVCCLGGGFGVGVHVMTLEVNLTRTGSSRSSVTAIPIVARVVQGGKFGGDLLAGRGIRDLTYAQETVYDVLRGKLGPGVIVKFTGVQT